LRILWHWMLLGIFYRYRLSLFFFFVLSLSFLSSNILEIVASVVSVFAASTSYHLKTTFFLFYALSCCFLAEHQATIHNPRSDQLRKLTFSIIFFLALLNIFLHFYFLRVYDLPFSFKAKYWIFIPGGMGDVTAFYHSHSLKAVWYCLAVILNIKSFFTRIDIQNIEEGGVFTGAGYAFFETLPAAIYYVATALYVILFFLFLMLAVCKINSWGKHRTIFLLIYVTSSFSILSNLADGGPATKEFLFSFAALFFVLRYNFSRKYSEMRIGLVVFILIAILIYFLYDLFGLDPGKKYYALLLLYGLPIGSLFLFFGRVRAYFVFLLCVWIAFIVTSYAHAGYFLRDDPKFYGLQLYPNEKVWITGYRQRLPKKKIFEYGFVAIYEDIIRKKSTLREYAQENNLDYRSYMNQVTFVGRSPSVYLDGRQGFASYAGLIKVRNVLKGVQEDLSLPFWRVILKPSSLEGFNYAFIFLSHVKVRHLNLCVLYTFLREMLKTEEMVIVIP